MARLVLLVLLAGLTLPAAAEAAFPGANGRIAFESSAPGGGVRILAVDDDGTARGPIVDPGQRPAWSPDGRRLAFARGGDLWVAAADGSDAVRVTTGAGDPAWSPDGLRIAFVRGSGAGRDLWAIDADGTDEVQVSVHPSGSESDPAWSPDGERIAYTFDDHSIWTIRPDGTGATPLTAALDGSEAEPDWSPDGTQLAFQGNGPEVIDADGTDRRSLEVEGGEPVWSPDGQWIAYRGALPEDDPSRRTPEIYKIRADRSERVLLTFHEGAIGEPSWQPVPRIAPAPTPPATPPATTPTPAVAPSPCSGRTRFRASLRAARRAVARRFRSLRSGRALHVRATACEPGELRVTARGTRSRRVLARGRAVFLARGTATLRLVPTPLGRRYARRPGRPALRVTGRFVAVP